MNETFRTILTLLIICASAALGAVAAGGSALVVAIAVLGAADIYLTKKGIIDPARDNK